MRRRDCILNTLSTAPDCKEREAIRVAGIAQASRFTWSFTPQAVRGSIVNCLTNELLDQ